MKSGISDQTLERLSGFIAEHLGLYFPPERWPDLRRGMLEAAIEFGSDDAEACAGRLMSEPLTKTRIEVLAGHLTVGETYFFREPRAFEAIEQEVLPELIGARRTGEQRLRFWSAACCTGEEPYSLAILLRRLLPDLPQWNVTILATDVNPRFLHRASRGVFGEWSFRDTPAWLKSCYFTPVGSKQYELRPEIRRMVTFEHLNLARDVFPSLLNDTNAIDLILCRNVLMYFEPGQVAPVVEKFRRSLVDDGWLVMGAAETSLAPDADFGHVQAEGAILLRKRGVKPVPVPAVDELAVVKPVPPAPAPAVSRDESGAKTARALANEGRLAEALQCADRMVAAEKLNPGSHYLRALILQEQGALHEAAKSLHRAVYLDHNFVLAHFALGNMARNAGRVREAGLHFTNALRSLREHAQDDILPESDGLTAGRLAEIIAATMAGEAAA